MKNISLILIMLFLAIVARAQVPGTMSFQGSLTEPGTNSPVADGDYAVVFTLYDALSGGVDVWTETHGALAVSDGVFNVLLGKNSPLDPNQFDKPLFLEISVGSEILTPRIELATSAFSQSAKSVAGTGNKIPSSGNVYIGGDLQVGPGGGSPLIDLSIDDNDTGLEVEQDGQLSFYSNGLEHVTLKPSGNIGIGTNAPTQLLDLKKLGSDNFIRIQAGDASSLLSGILLNENGLDFGWRMHFDANNDGFNIESQSDASTFANRMHINHSGEIGIGTTTPAEKLSVNGNIAANGAMKADGFEYRTTQTKYLTIPSAAFNLNGDTYTSTTSDAASYSTPILRHQTTSHYVSVAGGNQSVAATMVAPVYLPSGATVTTIEARLFETNATYDLSVDLIATPFGESNSGSVLGTAATTGTDGHQTVAASGLSITVDNELNAYYLRFNTRQATAGNMVLYHVRLTYEVDQLD